MNSILKDTSESYKTKNLQQKIWHGGTPYQTSLALKKSKTIHFSAIKISTSANTSVIGARTPYFLPIALYLRATHVTREERPTRFGQPGDVAGLISIAKIARTQPPRRAEVGAGKFKRGLLTTPQRTDRTRYAIINISLR